MKTKMGAILALVAILVSGCAAYAQSGVEQNSKVYQVETRLDDYVHPTSFVPTKATPSNGAVNENVLVVAQRVLNEGAPFLKKGVVKTVGEDRSSAWELLSDEGGAGHAQSSPNPLTYFAAGAASSLLTQVERNIQVLDLEVDDVKVETKIYFRWSDTMTDKWSGFTDKVVANILIKSDESPEKIKELKELAMKSWAVGEGLASRTEIDATVVINGDNWDGQNAVGGKVETPISIENGFTFTNVTPDLNLLTVDVEEDMAIDMHDIPNPLVFSEIGIAESANDSERPYMHRIRAKSLTENYATWELYADDSRGYEGLEKAPSSWNYFTAGTAFCLMSQITANDMFFRLDIKDYRVEQQIDYRQENFMTPGATGFVDHVITRVLFDSEAPAEDLEAYFAQSLRCCFAGEALKNETEMESTLYLNGEIVK